MRFRTAAAALLVSTAAAAAGASVSAAGSPATVTVTYGRAALVVPTGWTLARRPTCTSRTTALRLSARPLGRAAEWIMVGEITRVARPACWRDAKAEPGAPDARIVHIVVHGLAVNELSGLEGLGDHVQWSVPSLHVLVWGVGPDVPSIVHTLHRSG